MALTTSDTVGSLDHSVRVRAYSNVTLFCSADAFPIPRNINFFYYDNLTNEPFFLSTKVDEGLFSSYIMHIGGSPEYNGTVFECTALNMVGTGVAYLTAIVEGKCIL